MRKLSALFLAVLVVVGLLLLWTLGYAQAVGPQTPAFDFRTLLPDQNTLIQWLVSGLLAVGLLSLLANFLAGLVAGVPFVGPVLSKLVLFMAGKWGDYLAKVVPTLADQAVQAVEEKFRNQAGQSVLKENTAKELLEKSAPTLKGDKERVQAALDAALARLRGQGLEQKAGQ